ncbi:MAG: hypothetical protein QOC81_2622 [Thermoanaerobaculia bacterium]|jgi:hypothetical protein|nr:hypothetical protein [Thermoanaerobaculia bacterium]
MIFRQASAARWFPRSAGKRESRSASTTTSDVLDWFRHKVNAAGGGNYQTMLNNALREYVAEHKEPIEKTIRRVIREELKKRGAA